jgi:hypothetical protein
MSFVTEAAFAPQEARFDFSKALSEARRVLVRRVWPNLRDDVGLLYEKTAAFGVWVAHYAFVAEKNCDTTFDPAVYPVPPKVIKKRESRGGFSSLGMPMAAATFMAAMFAPTSFSTRSHIQDYESDFTIVSQSQATEPDAVPEYAVIDSDEWRANRARLLAAYAERRAHEHPVAEVPVYVTAHQELNGVRVTSAFGGDEYEHRDY